MNGCALIMEIKICENIIKFFRKKVFKLKNM